LLLPLVGFLLQVPDYWNAKILGLPTQTVIDDAKWLEEEFTPRVQTVSPTHRWQNLE